MSLLGMSTLAVRAEPCYHYLVKSTVPLRLLKLCPSLTSISLDEIILPLEFVTLQTQGYVNNDSTNGITEL